MKRISLSRLTAALLILTNSAVAAEDIVLGEVSVTANKISENLKDVPQSISVISDVDLEERGVKNVEELVKTIPNISGVGGMYEGISTRGLNPSIYTSSNPVTVYIGGVAQSNKDAAYIPVTNIDHVEVLRGPSSAIYGKDSIGGIINIVLKEPENEWRGSVGTEYGSNKYMMGLFETNGALIDDKLFLGLNGSASKEDGWIINDLNGDKANDKKNYNFGLNLKIVPTDRLTVKIRGDVFHRQDDSLDELFIPKSRFYDISKSEAKHINLETPARVKQTSTSGAIDLKYEFDKFNVTSATTFRRAKKDGLYDEDFGSKATYLHPDHYGLVTFLNSKNDTLSQELRFSSIDEQSFKWVGGLYFENEKQVFGPIGDQYGYGGNTIVEDWPSVNRAQTISTFGQVIYPVTSRFDVTLGGRLQQIKKHTKVDYFSYPLGHTPGTPAFSMDEKETFRTFLPKFALGYDLTNELNIYAMYSKGYLAGGFNFYTTGGSRKDNKFDAQTSDDYEIGLKGTYDSFRFSTALFYMAIKGTHIFYTDPNNSNIYYISNADKSTSMGVEFEGTLKASKEIDINLAASLLKTKYGNYINKDGSNNKGNRIEKNPEYKISLGASYYAPMGIYARLDGNMIGKTYFDEQNTLAQKSYFTADAKVGYLKDSFDVYLYVKNLTDKEYFTHARARASNVLVTYGKGRTFGIGVKYSF
ncbi:TonB-dependent receptor [Campylobacter concisus]|uniref:TonB-dependent receptor n=1 Tax=Campylobacter concisus TaxID=199 RepID=UPI000CD9F6AE|nr:TonB-dependent receptor [Campylobacter concisus]QPH87240.1 TonB-dependent receptor [Campylobacter concisus]QPI02178.1 TonB-dependent receptor [Campylobacter concisus]